MEELQKGSNVKNTKADKNKKKFGIKNQDNTAKTKESLKQEVQAKAQRLRQYTKRANFFRQNKTFRDNAKKLYRELEKKTITSRNPPSLVEVETFWSKIRENSKTHNDAAHWIQDRAKENQHVPTQEYTTNLPMPTTISSRTQNSPQSGWPRVWLSWYQTSKTQGTLKTTGLSHAYQLCTRPWPPSLQKGPVESNNLLPKEQKGCRRRSYGCKDQLLINKAILEKVRSKSRNLSTT